MKKGNIVRIVFDDHCAHSEEAAEVLPCEVIGRVVAFDRKQIILRTWGCPDNLIYDINSDGYTILRSAITKLTILRKN